MTIFDLLDYMKQKNDWVTSRELSEHFGIRQGTISTCLKKAYGNIDCLERDPPYERFFGNKPYRYRYKGER
jgi:hypothetical protein